MSGRIRNPSVRALEAQRDAYAIEELAPPQRASRKQKAAAPVSAPDPAPARRGNAVIRGLDTETDEDVVMSAPASQEELSEGEKDPDFTLYCICLGFDTGEQPMIQCEHCNNWFHFRCIGLDEERAALIDAYCCDICTEMGLGTTRTINDAPLQPVDYDEASSPSLTGTFDEDQEDPLAVEDDDEEYSAETGPSFGGVKRAKKTPGGNKQRTRRKVSTAEGDEEYVGENEVSPTINSPRNKANTPKVSASKKGTRRGSFVDDKDDDLAPKSRVRGARKSAPTAPPPHIDLANAPSAPPSDKTRTHCVNQLTAIFKSVFSANEGESNSVGVEVRAAAFAESVESELFEGFAELDPKNIRSPRTKYVAKFRSLHFNLKTNAVFRSRISSSDLTPAQIVNMSNEDLLTPELRAMADTVRAASLKHSVKEVTAAPTAKRTHKGEEEIDNHAVAAAQAEEKALAERDERERRQRSESASQRSPQPSPRVEASPSFFGSPPATAGDLSASPSSTPFASSSAPRQRSSLPHSSVAISAEDIGLDAEDEKPIKPPTPRRKASGSAHPFDSASPASKMGDSPVPGGEDGDMAPPPLPARARSSFDMSSVWGNIKASPQLESSEKMESTDANEDEGEEEENDRPQPFAVLSAKTGDDDDFEASLLRGDGAVKEKAPRSTTPEEPPTSTQSLAELPSVWNGDLIVPDEGGFPATCVQVGGRPFGAAADVWERLLPRTFTMDGRMPTKTAHKYLLDCSFASSRELVVVAVLPDLSGPTDLAPQKPTKESCLAKHKHIFDFYVKKERIGVIAPTRELKKVVKDIYFLPLRKWDPLPEWAELLDDHKIPEPSGRDGDLLLCVLVTQKGAIPSVKPPSPLPAPTSAAASAPSAGTPASHDSEPTSAAQPTAQNQIQPRPQTQAQTPLPRFAPPPGASPVPLPPNSGHGGPPHSVSPYLAGGQPFDRPPSNSYDPPRHPHGAPPGSYRQPSAYSQHSPPYPQNSPPYDQRSPLYNNHQSPPYGGQHSPHYGQRSPPYSASSSAPPPAVDASAILSGIDTSALSSLLANPSLLQAAVAQSQPPSSFGVQSPAPQGPAMEGQQWGGSSGGRNYDGYGAGRQYDGGYGYGGGGGQPPTGGGGYIHPSRAAMMDSSASGPPPGEMGYSAGGYGGRGGYGGAQGGYDAGRGGYSQGYGVNGGGGGWNRGRGRGRGGAY